MGQAVIDSLNGASSLLAEAPTGTGKSLAVLVPLISEIRKDKNVRAVVSTATKSLQDQYMGDLDDLNKIFDQSFTYRSLKGRDNYLCFNAFKQNSRNNQKMTSILLKLENSQGALRDGERGDVERVLRRELDDYEWSYMAGASKRCGENKCTRDECYSARARELAAGANIVITNNAVLRVDAETRSDDGMSDPFLGEVDFLVVDEAHELEESLIDGWTEEITEWELNDMAGSVQTSVTLASAHKDTEGLGYRVEMAVTSIKDFLTSVTRFYSAFHHGTEWNFVTDALCMKYVRNGASQPLIRAMEEYEEESAERINYALEVLEDVDKYLGEVLKYMFEGGIKGTRKISKGRTSARSLTKTLSKVVEALSTKNGVLVAYGVPYSVLVSGIVRRTGEYACKISVVPMDISTKAQDIWKDRTCILMSATMRDLSTGDFRYIKTSLGFEAKKELALDAVFDLANKQVTYVTPGEAGGYGDIADVPGARYSKNELVDLIQAAKGRTLVLFTARRELDDAASFLMRMKAQGEFQWPLYIQTKDANKAKLAEDFKNDEYSVLLATKSFFQGANFPGSGLSLVIIVKYPLPQYNTLCKNRIQWWKSKGFPNWYESKSMEVYHQASGRLLRTETDFGVVALLDQRTTDPSQMVCKTALKAVRSLGSPVIRDVASVSAFLGS